MTDPTTEYLTAAAGPDGADLAGCIRGMLVDLGLSQRLHRLLPRPVFAPRATVAAAAEATGRLVALLESLVDRRFGGDPRAMLRAQAMPEPVIDAIVAGSLGERIPHVRSDVILHRGHPYIIELNVGSGLGGTYLGPYYDALLRQPAFARFAAAHDLHHIDTSVAFAAQVRRYATRIVGTADPVAAVVEETGSGLGADFVVTGLRQHGVPTHHGELSQLSLHDGRILLGAEPIDVVIRYFLAAQVPDEPGGPRVLEQLVQAHRSGRTALFTTLDHELVDAKSALALLYEPSVAAVLTVQERRFVRTYVPWTRQIGTDFRLAPHERAALVARCARDRASMVLKPGVGFGAGGVYFGTDFTADEWLALLDSPATAGHVVQHRIDPDEEVMYEPATGTTQAWHINWGVFLTDIGYSGLFLRGRLAGDGGPIGAGRHTRAGLGFTYPAEPAGA